MRAVSVLLVAFLYKDAGAAQPEELGLSAALLAAESASPELKAAAAAEAQAVSELRLGRSYYYPSLEAQGIQSYGFAGSNGALGLGGLMSSPFRYGPAGGLVSQWTLFDAGRGYRLSAARARLDAAKARARAARYAVDEAALRAYLEAATDRAQSEAWREVGARVTQTLQAVERFVRTGQHSPVERLLLQDQADEAAMNRDAFAARYEIALRRLALLLGRPDAALACPAVNAISTGAASNWIPGPGSPDVERARADERAARQVAGQRAGERLPRLAALGSVGAMQRARLVDMKDYSAGVGISVPLFEGFRLSGALAQAREAAAERASDLDAARLRAAEAELGFDEASETARVRLGYLDRQLDNAGQAFELARRRYLAFEGPLVDVREALRNLGRVRSQRNDAASELLLAHCAKLLFNGAQPRAP